MILHLTLITSQNEPFKVGGRFREVLLYILYPKSSFKKRGGAGRSSGSRALCSKDLDPPAWRMHLQFGLFFVPISGPQLVHQRLRYVVLCLTPLVVPYFDYGDIIFLWGITVRLHKLQRLQNRALRICHGKSKLFPTQELHKIAQVKFLTNRQQHHLRLYVYNKHQTEKEIRRLQTRCTRKQWWSTISSGKIKMQCIWSQCS